MSPEQKYNVPTYEDLKNNNKFVIEDNEEIYAYAKKDERNRVIFNKINNKTLKKNCIIIEIEPNHCEPFKTQRDKIYADATIKLLKVSNCYKWDIIGSDKYKFMRVECDCRHYS